MGGWVDMLSPRNPMKPRILDLFCGAGGAAMGLHQAGFEVVGVDIKPQPHYPFEFVEQDTLQALRHLRDGAPIMQTNNLLWHVEDFDALWASPPCQAWTKAAKQWRSEGVVYPELITPTRDYFKSMSKPYVIENVPGAPLLNPIILNGATFGLRVHRERWFECSFDVPFILLNQGQRPVKMGRPIQKNDVVQPVGHFSGVPQTRKAMGIDWMNQGELAQAIPPAYSRFIGEQLMKVLR